MPHVFRNKHHQLEPIWHVQIAIILAASLQVIIPDKFIFGPRYVLPVIEILLMLALAFTTPQEKIFKSLARRINVILLLGIAAVANAYSLGEVANELLKGGRIANGRALILTALNIYLTNIIIFGLAYWEMDGGGPGERLTVPKHEQDFLFPQHQNEDYKHPEWIPTFFDYLYVSSTNGMAFSPTDTMPLSRRAKLLMLIQATLSLVTIGLVAARAVNILG
jgi:uncharacterized membrane protein